MEKSSRRSLCFLTTCGSAPSSATGKNSELKAGRNLHIQFQHTTEATQENCSNAYFLRSTNTNGFADCPEPFADATSHFSNIWVWSTWWHNGSCQRAQMPMTILFSNSDVPQSKCCHSTDCVKCFQTTCHWHDSDASFNCVGLHPDTPGGGHRDTGVLAHGAERCTVSMEPRRCF